MSTVMNPAEIDDPINSRILSVSEDQLSGFVRRPIEEITRRTGIDSSTVIGRIRAMLAAGTIRRVRQTLLATNLAHGALVAWRVDQEKLQQTFDWMFKNDPFSGHVVIRSTDAAVAAGQWRLWTTLKVPQGFALEKHCDLLCRLTGAEKFKIMPAKRLFALGVGHVRRRGIELGSKSEELAEAMEPAVIELSELDWRVLIPLKREFEAEEIGEDLWTERAEEAGVSLLEFYRVAEDLNRRGVVGRFSTFLEHVKPLSDGQRVTKFNALFHWAVPAGREIEAGRQVGRFHILTHAYWREGGLEFGNVNLMAVAHGTDKQLVLKHKEAIDEHLSTIGMPVSYTNVFWGGRSEIKPSEISPVEYRKWWQRYGNQTGR